MSAATSNTAALFFVTALVVLLALMLFAVFRLPEWQPSTTDGGGRPLLPSVPAQPVPAQAGPSLFQAAEAAEDPRLPRRATAASWAAAAGQPDRAAPLGRPGEAIPLGEHGRLAEPALLGEAGGRPGDPGFAARRDREQLEQATVGRVVVPGSPPWGPAPRPPGIS